MSVRDALRVAKIRELKPPQPVCIETSTTVAEAIISMHGTYAGCVLVCEDGRVKGILTERDVLNKLAGREIAPDSSVEQYMTSDPETLTADDHLDEAIRLMDAGGYRHLPLVSSSGKVEGIISIQNIIEFLAELLPEEVLNLPPRPHQYMDSREGG